jgi:hypothetical protein
MDYQSRSPTCGAIVGMNHQATLDSKPNLSKSAHSATFNTAHSPTNHSANQPRWSNVIGHASFATSIMRSEEVRRQSQRPVQLPYYHGGATGRDRIDRYFGPVFTWRRRLGVRSLARLDVKRHRAHLTHGQHPDTQRTTRRKRPRPIFAPLLERDDGLHISNLRSQPLRRTNA